MFIKRLKHMAETIGLACFALLAVYGLLGLVRGGPAAWAARSPAPAEAPEETPARAPNRSDGDTWDGATVPLVMNYQGTLHDAEGNPFTGYYTMTFRVYTDVIAPITSSVWSEQHLSVTVRGGRFNVLLGNVEPISNPIPADLFNDPDRFVGVQVAGYDEMVPRQRFASVPYALHANHATDSDLLNEHTADELVPPGSVVAFAGETPPDGWLVCDGSVITSTDYPDLYVAIGTAHGNGNDVDPATVNLPDYRGYFLRGVDAGTGRDPDALSRTAIITGANAGNAVGSVQEDQMQSHKHNDAGHTHPSSVWGGTTDNSGYGHTPIRLADSYSSIAEGYADLGDPTKSNAGPVSHGAENRPKNAYVIWIIKY
jgi:microcystin-dependent protein